MTFSILRCKFGWKATMKSMKTSPLRHHIFLYLFCIFCIFVTCFLLSRDEHIDDDASNAVQMSGYLLCKEVLKQRWLEETLCFCALPNCEKKYYLADVPMRSVIPVTLHMAGLLSQLSTTAEMELNVHSITSRSNPTKIFTSLRQSRAAVQMKQWKHTFGHR